MNRFTILLIAAALTLIPLTGYAEVQLPTIYNQGATGGPGIPIYIGAAPGQRAHLYTVDAWCDAGTARIVINDGSSTVALTPEGSVGTTMTRLQWNPGLTSVNPNTVMTVYLTACSAGTGFGALFIQADRY